MCCFANAKRCACINSTANLIAMVEQDTEDCKLVVTCKMQNRNATDKLNRLNQQCSKLALFANTISEICGRI